MKMKIEETLEIEKLEKIKIGEEGIWDELVNGSRMNRERTEDKKSV